MGFTRAWVNFKRMEDISAVAAALVYGAVVVEAFQELSAGAALVARWTLVWPAGFLAATLLPSLVVPPIRRWLLRYVWMSFRAGFGQTPASVLFSVGLLLGATALVMHLLNAKAEAHANPASLFCAFAAGVGIMVAQAALVRNLERRPEIRAVIRES